MPTVLQTATQTRSRLGQIALQASPRDGIGIRRPQSTNANRRHPDIHPRPPTPSRRHVHPRRIRRQWPLPRRLRRPPRFIEAHISSWDCPRLTVVHAAGGSVNGYLTTDALLKATRSSPHHRSTAFTPATYPGLSTCMHRQSPRGRGGAPDRARSCTGWRTERWVVVASPSRGRRPRCARASPSPRPGGR
jgi:hypothetical protein